MTRYVVDAPVLIGIAEGRIGVAPHHALVGPSSLRSRALELLLADVRAGRREERAARAVLEHVAEVRIRLLGDRGSRDMTWRLAQRWSLDAALAEHLAVARLQADALASADPALLAAAELAGVPTATVAELGA